MKSKYKSNSTGTAGKFNLGYNNNFIIKNSNIVITTAQQQQH